MAKQAKSKAVPAVETVTPSPQPKEPVFHATGASDVIINYDRHAPKELHVKIEGLGRPEFTFTGAWSGKDVRTITNNIFRAYHLNVRQLRRENQAINPVYGGKL